MKKRMIAFLCALTLIVGLLPAGTVTVASAETTNATTYDVGYASKNLNPWVSSDFEVTTDVGTAVFLPDPENTADKKIYPRLFSQTGNQIDWESVVTDLHDDNGDGTVDHGDGIFATCTAVTYGKGTADEKTVLFITTDTMKAWDSLVSAVRSGITASEWGKELGITPDQIMVSSNHTHSGPALSSSSGFADSYIDTSVFTTETMQEDLKTDRKNYYDWVVGRIVAAAKESVEDQAPATMSKGSVNATEATAAMGYNDGEGYHMNTIRHYERTLKSSFIFWSGEVSSIYANTSTPSHDKLVAQLKEYNHDAKNIFNLQSDYTTEWSTTDDADNTMYVLRFEFEDSTKKPVVFVNWRAHSTMNSGILNHSVLSGDYATGLRQALADMDEGYRAAFFLGAAGNVVPHPTSNVYTVDGALVKDKMDWLYEATYTNTSGALTVNSAEKTFIYGKMLAEIAQYCMEETDASGNSYMTDTSVGEIRTYSVSWVSEKNQYSQELLEAAIALRAEVMAANSWTQTQFESNYKVHLKEKSSTYFPYYYKVDGATAAIINSRLHFNTIYSQAKTVIDNGKTVADYNNAIELNAIKLGENVAFITSPNELADYYHDFTGDITSHTVSEKEAHNDWFNLKDNAYGMPFVLGYSNQNSGYIAGWLDHQANSQTHATITGLGADGYMLYSPGTYESMTSSFAAGQGEELMNVYDKMLDIASGEYDKKAPCPYCSPDEDVTWTPLFADNASDTNWVGHHYLYEDLENSACRTINTGDLLCLDLNGKTINANNRAFNTRENSSSTPEDESAKNATVNIIDSVGTGKVIGNYAANNPYGGAIKIIGSSNTLNIYGGTFSFNNIEGEYDATTKYGTGRGGVIALTGKLNLYGGTIQGTTMKDISARNDFSAYLGQGGAVFVNSGGTLNVYGGSIISGSVPATGAGPCVYLASTSSKILLSGDGDVNDIYFNANNGSNLTVSGTYTGTANLSFNSSIALTNGTQIGVASNNANFDDDAFTISDDGDWGISVKNGKLLLSGYASDTVAMIGGVEYKSLQSAVDAYNGTIIKMVRDENADVSVTGKDVYLDLNGCSINGAVSAAGDYTLYCKDSMTDDFTVADDKYGRITNIAENSDVQGIPEESDLADDGYLKIKEADGVSFHRVDLGLTDITLRAVHNSVCTPSVYYKCNFKGDEKVAAAVDYYGVALSVQKMPDVSNIESAACKFSQITKGFQAGETGNSGNGTLLKGIMKPENTPVANTRYSNMAIYGKAYIHTADGYMMGSGAQRTLKQVAQEADTAWSTLTAAQQESMITMYNTYKAIMEKWSLPNLVNAIG